MPKTDKPLDLLDNNAAWAERMVTEDANYFRQLLAQQAPRYLWIGCSDSRVPANVIVDLPPGELFVHRNIANLVSRTDPNCLAVLHYAIEVLHVQHVIVCGHYGCGGVRAALAGDAAGIVGQWLQPLRELRDRHRQEIDRAPSESDRADRLCELNVLEQVRHVAGTAAVQGAWNRGQTLAVHGWIYGLHDGRLRDLDCSIGGPAR